MASSSATSSTATSVVPMPSSWGSLLDASNTRRLASSTARNNTCGSLCQESRTTSATVSTASREAISPARAPPIPSASRYNPMSGTIRQQSSLFVRTRPTSVTAKDSSIITETNAASVRGRVRHSACLLLYRRIENLDRSGTKFRLSRPHRRWLRKSGFRRPPHETARYCHQDQNQAESADDGGARRKINFKGKINTNPRNQRAHGPANSQPRANPFRIQHGADRGHDQITENQ